MPESANFQLISKALSNYSKQTGIDLTKNPFTDQFHRCNSAKAISQLLQDRAKAFETYRNEYRRLINCLGPAFRFLHVFSGTLGDALSLVPFPPAKAIFVGINVLLDAASSVNASYNALVQVFERVGNFLKRLEIYARIQLTPPMTDIIVQIMMKILSVLALATKEIKQGLFKKFVKKIFKESEIEDMLQGLKDLIAEEGHMALVRLLEVFQRGDAKEAIKGM
ncbi:hypothetical protein BGW80DRAFT_1254906 [Lactifluus volemus]|nr:hypothetical protein BGW80DRAFT_1254906 [Lactifluus volemus]